MNRAEWYKQVRACRVKVTDVKWVDSPPRISSMYGHSDIGEQLVMLGLAVKETEWGNGYMIEAIYHPTYDHLMWDGKEMKNGLVVRTQQTGRP